MVRSVTWSGCPKGLVLARILLCLPVMPASTGRWDWRISALLFGAILIALIIAALLQDPLIGSLP